MRIILNVPDFSQNVDTFLIIRFLNTATFKYTYFHLYLDNFEFVLFSTQPR